MKLALKRSFLLLAVLLSFGVRAEPVAISVTTAGYSIAGEQVATTDLLIQELQARNSKEVLVSLSPDASMDSLSKLVTALQQQGMKVGFVSSPAHQ